MHGHDYEFRVMHQERVRDMQRTIAGHTALPARPRVAATDNEVTNPGILGARRSGTPFRPVRRVVSRLAAALIVTGNSLHRWADAR
jgi:hypothetical protein